ncbi:hypothetical protein BAL199_07158 [alpha proteobacterium BAL199]|nr:hypothetical protein BAL199_07158 [alpha proteobacterium BAL199]
MELLRSMFNRFDQILDWIGRSFGSIVSYVLIGAMVVVPIWLVLFLIDWSKQRGK